MTTYTLLDDRYSTSNDTRVSTLEARFANKAAYLGNVPNMAGVTVAGITVVSATDYTQLATKINAVRDACVTGGIMKNAQGN